MSTTQATYTVKTFAFRGMPAEVVAAALRVANAWGGRVGGEVHATLHQPTMASYALELTNEWGDYAVTDIG